MNQIPAGIGFAFQPSIFGRGVGGGNAIDVEIIGSNMDDLRRSAEYGSILGTAQCADNPDANVTDADH